MNQYYYIGGGNILGTDSSFTIDNVKRNTGYICIVTDKYGNSEDIWFYINIDNGFKAYPSDAENHDNNSISYNIKPNESKTLAVTIEAEDKDGITYVWQDKNGNTISGATGSSFEVEKASKTTWYYCNVSDKYDNSQTVYFKIEVNHFDAYASGTKSSNASYNIKPNEKKKLSVDVSADDTSNISYKWQYENDGYYRDIEGETGNSISIDAKECEKLYRCVISDGYGNSKNIDFGISIYNALALYVKNTNKNTVYMTAEPGSKKTLSVTASGLNLDGITYQWYDSSYDRIPGATDTSYTTDVINSFDPCKYYYCEATDSYGNTATAHFTIYPTNSIKAYVSGTKVTYITYNLKPGEDKKLSVDVVADDTEDIVYTWYKKNDDSYEYSIIEGETGSSLQVTNVSSYQIYRCIVTGNGQKKEVNFSIKVNNLRAYVSGTEKTYKEYNASFGSGITFSVDVYADDKTGITYEWKNPDNEIIETAKGKSLTVDNIKKPGYYGCEIKDKYGNSRYVSFRVQTNNFSAYAAGTKRTDITYYLKDKEIKTLSVDVTADDKKGITYTWQHYLQNGGGYTSIDNTTDSCRGSISNVANREEYRCIVKDNYGNEKYVYFYLYSDNQTINAYAKDTKESSIDISAKTGDKIKLAVDVEAADVSKVTYRWNERINYTDFILEGATGSAYTTDSVNKNTKYSCTVTDQKGNQSTVYFNIKVNDLKAFVSKTTETEKVYTVKYGDTTELAVDVSAEDMTDLKYVWYKGESKNISSAYLMEDMFGKSSITTEPAKYKTWYFCEVSDKYGNTSVVRFDVDVDNDLSAFISGTKETEKLYIVNKGDSLSLINEVSANNMNNLKYEWQRFGKDGFYTNLGYYDSSLILTKIVENGIYRCIITDNFGNSVVLVYKVYIRQFDDVPDNAGYAFPVYWALDMGITAGKTANLFDPKGGCTRAQFVTFLWRYAGSPEPTKYQTFSDVPSTKGYYKAIMWAAENGITAGLSGRRTGQFGPNDVCTREQCVTFMYRFAKVPAVTAEDHANYSFADVSSKSYYYDSITWAAKNGVTSGINSTSFGVGRDCTRSQMVSFLNRFYYYQKPYLRPDYNNDI